MSITIVAGSLARLLATKLLLFLQGEAPLAIEAQLLSNKESLLKIDRPLLSNKESLLKIDRPLPSNKDRSPFPQVKRSVNLFQSGIDGRLGDRWLIATRGDKIVGFRTAYHAS